MNTCKKSLIVIAVANVISLTLFMVSKIWEMFKNCSGAKKYCQELKGLAVQMT